MEFDETGEYLACPTNYFPGGFCVWTDKETTLKFVECTRMSSFVFHWDITMIIIHQMCSWNDVKMFDSIDSKANLHLVTDNHGICYQKGRSVKCIWCSTEAWYELITFFDNPLGWFNFRSHLNPLIPSWHLNHKNHLASRKPQSRSYNPKSTSDCGQPNTRPTHTHILFQFIDFCCSGCATALAVFNTVYR